MNLFTEIMKRKKLVAIAGAAVIVVAAAGAGAYWWYTEQPPDPKTAATEEVLTYVASEKFTNQSDEKKKEYFEQIQESGKPPQEMMQAARKLPEPEQKKLREQMGAMFQAHMRREMNRYFELSPEEKVAYLDNIIDRFGQGPPPGARRPPDGNNREGRDGPGGPHGHHGPPSQGEMRKHFKNMLKHTSGEDQAHFMQFMEDMRRRRKERGLPEFPRFRPH